MKRSLVGWALGTLLLLPLAAAAQTPEWRSGFETGFPGEWLDYDGGAYTADGTPNPGVNEAWTIVDAASDPLVPFGNHAYRGWPIAAQNESHRAYPGIHCDISSPLVNLFWVYLDVDYDQLSPPEWVHFATWGNNPDWNVHTMSVRDRKVEMAHLNWQYIGPEPQPDFPLQQWVRFTAYINYEGAQGTIRVWQDGTPILEGTYDQVAGTSLMRAHWGWYSSGSIDQGVQYNDEIQIWSLDAPLADLDTEPASPYTPDPPVGGGGAGAGGVGAGGSGGTSQSGGNAPGGSTASGGTSSGGTSPAAAAPDAGDTDDGCGCRAAGRNEPSPPWWALGVGLLATVRRRRQR